MLQYSQLHSKRIVEISTLSSWPSIILGVITPRIILGIIYIFLKFSPKVLVFIMLRYVEDTHASGRACVECTEL